LPPGQNEAAIAREDDGRVAQKADQRASPKDAPESNMTGGSENHEQPFREDVSQQDRRRQIGPGSDVGHPANFAAYRSVIKRFCPKKWLIPG
jgi:hypothetical protein